jgi:hypothetical protein
MFWYWQALPKQTSAKKQAIKKNARAQGATPAGKISVKKSMPAQAPADHTANSEGRYRAVSIKSRNESCAAAKALGDQRFLVKSAPTLPLPDCDRAPCHCSYVHHADQRAVDEDRRSVHSLQTELYTRTAERERRNRRGRRKGDNS